MRKQVSLAKYPLARGLAPQCVWDSFGFFGATLLFLLFLLYTCCVNFQRSTTTTAQGCVLVLFGKLAEQVPRSLLGSIGVGMPSQLGRKLCDSTGAATGPFGV